MTNNQLPECLLKSKSFQTLSQEELNFIAKKHRIVHYNRNEFIIKQGTFGSQIMFLKEGLVKIFIEFHGAINILTVETTGAFLGLPVISGSNVFPYSIIPIEKSAVCLFDIQDFLTIIRGNGLFALELLQQTNDYLICSFDRLNCLTHKQIHGRFATIMLCLAERIYKAKTFTLSLSRKDLAELTSMSVPSLSRVIKEFNDDNIIEIEGKEVKILDFNKLNQIVRTG